MSKVNFFFVDSLKHGPGVVAAKTSDLPAGEYPFEEYEIGRARLRFVDPQDFSMRERLAVADMARNDPVFGRYVNSIQEDRQKTARTN